MLFTGQEREVQKSYWIEHSAELTVEAMMLDSKASDLDKEERPEVLLLLPPFPLSLLFKIFKSMLSLLIYNCRINLPSFIDHRSVIHKGTAKY